MDFERLQEAWQKQIDNEDIMYAFQLKLGRHQLDVRCADPGPEGETQIEKVMRRCRRLDRGIWWRDMRESVVAILMAGVILAIDHIIGRHSLLFYLASACCLYFPIFFYVDRRLQGRPRSAPSVKEFLEDHLRSVNHQIWLLTNVLWWYLLPCVVIILLMMGEVLRLSGSWRSVYPGAVSTLFLVAILYPAIWAMNQDAVKKALVPQKLSLEAALKELDSQ